MINAIVTDKQYTAGEAIKELRNEKGLTIRELATRAGVSESGLYRWENGERVPSIDVYNRIIKALGADIVVIRSRRADDRAPASQEG